MHFFILCCLGYLYTCIDVSGRGLESPHVRFFGTVAPVCGREELVERHDQQVFHLLTREEKGEPPLYRQQFPHLSGVRLCQRIGEDSVGNQCTNYHCCYCCQFSFNVFQHFTKDERVIIERDATFF